MVFCDRSMAKDRLKNNVFMMICKCMHWRVNGPTLSCSMSTPKKPKRETLPYHVSFINTTCFNACTPICVYFFFLQFFFFYFEYIDKILKIYENSLKQSAEWTNCAWKIVPQYDFLSNYLISVCVCVGSPNKIVSSWENKGKHFILMCI